MNVTAAEYSKRYNGRINATDGPICPYCNKPSVLRPEKAIYSAYYSDKLYWVCQNYPSCNSYVGTHGNGNWMNFPLGRLSDPELRKLKKKCHDLFDHIWKSKIAPRAACYRWMQRVMNLREPYAHIGEFDIEQCHELIHELNKVYDNPASIISKS